MKYTDPDGREPESFLMTVIGIANVERPGYPTIQFVSQNGKNASLMFTGKQSEGMTISVNPGSSVYVRGKNCPFGILITNNSDSSFTFDAAFLINAYVDKLEGMQSELQGIYNDWSASADEALDSVLGVAGILGQVLGSLASRGPEDAVQTLAEGTNDLIENIQGYVDGLTSEIEDKSAFEKLLKELHTDIYLQID